MSELTVFNFDGAEVRAVTGPDGEPRFVAADSAKILGYGGGARNAIARLPERMKGVEKINTLGGVQEMTVINEAGLNRLIMRSNVPGAERFQDWIAEEVLPSIRKTGSYGAPSLTGKELLARAVIEANEMIAEKDTQIRQLAPKARAFDGFIGADGDYSFNEAAKMLQRRGMDTGQYRLVNLLIEWGWVYRGRKSVPRAKQAQVDTGRLTEKTHYFIDQRTGEERAGATQVRLTPKGVAAIYDRYMPASLDVEVA